MLKFLKYFFAILFIWIFLAQFVILKFRFSNTKAYSIFKAKNLDLIIKDTLINNCPINYAITGNSNLPTLIFIHGSPGSWNSFYDYMIDTTLRKKFRIVSIDRPGFGYSNFGKAMHLQDQCNVILPLLQQFKSNKPLYVCGHSMGGPVAIQLAAMDTGLFNTIVIAAGSISMAYEPKETWRKIVQYPPFKYCVPGAFLPSNTEINYLKKDLIPLQNAFEKVTCKVNFIHGDIDTWVPIGNVGYGISMLKNAAAIKTDTIKNADHLFPWKQKKAFLNLLLAL